jgi:hypothetical protein
MAPMIEPGPIMPCEHDASRVGSRCCVIIPSTEPADWPETGSLGLQVNVMASVPTRQSPAVPPAESVEEKFDRLAAAWHKAVAHHSSSRIRDGHPAYQEIIGMGQAVVPFLLRDLQINRRHWFTALAVITGTDPIPDEDAGKIPQMAEAWLRWGREHGYRW